MKSKYHTISLLFSTILLSLGVNAAPTITFQGEVTSQTCSVDINGSTDSVVLLPTVGMAEFGNPLAGGQTAGLTPFTVSVTGCIAPKSVDQKINTTFLGYDVDSASGVMGNRSSSSNAASGIGIQLTTSGSGGTPVILKGATSVPGLVLNAGKTSTSYDFGVRYYVLKASAMPGSITAVAEYTLSYL